MLVITDFSILIIVNVSIKNIYGIGDSDIHIFVPLVVNKVHCVEIPLVWAMGEGWSTYGGICVQQK